ncbi:hypothetical protein B0H19DRAFT_1346049 [Mycena capillaripes]|nr:hypothetical protein B0H19DRAFT_1346049 [Mycena capillaripes]
MLDPARISSPVDYRVAGRRQAKTWKEPDKWPRLFWEWMLGLYSDDKLEGWMGSWLIKESHRNHVFRPEHSICMQHAFDAYKGTNNKIMVFCRTKALTDDVAKRLGTQGYHSETPIETRKKLFDDFKNHVTNVLTGTSLIGRGIDQPVTDVVHIDVGWSILDQIQEDNSGGRQNRPTRAMYFVPENRQPIPPDPTRPFGFELLVPWALHPTECRRLALSLFLDGVGYTCMSMKNMSLWDNCLRKAHDPTRVAPSLPLPTPIRNPEDYGNIDLVGASKGPATSKTAPRATGRALAIAAPLLGATSMPVAAAQTNDQEHSSILSPPGCDSDEEEPQDFFGLFSAPIATRREPALPSSPPSSPSWDPLSTSSLMRSRQAQPALPPPENGEHQRQRNGDVNLPRISEPPRTTFPAHLPIASSSRPDPQRNGAMELPRVGSRVPATMEHSAHVQPPSGSYSDPLSALVSTSRNIPSSQPHRATAANVLPPGLSVQRLNHERKTAEDQKFKFYRQVRQALENLQHGCAACWDVVFLAGHAMSAKAAHTAEQGWAMISGMGGRGVPCGGRTWKVIVGAVLAPGTGKKKIHPWLEDLGNCPPKDLVKAAIYARATKSADNIRIQLMVPAEATDGATFEALWEWLLRIDPTAQEKSRTSWYCS